ncbi:MULTISPECIES: 4Fe-4S dicluster domain-containing protein [Thermus]|jgi:Fe-S-cluster-containing dehydrogenase component|uniref:NrfC protein n=2 Tax=Thermus TaxID=270 RepID=Q72LA5_THET2|nr:MULTISPECIES: 4Fe-4S dicluster domain-containing protein [Thermus]2VPW_B Chain B, NRFC PROTEIN [Thermus thermophilus HB27]2VPW_F Chain F, NRFC PROTEIN [Thermus thermophilus HB27]2VPX_B Chain B, Nrfc Protein [Thermus thermophilus HB27]2VPX_F Chain F, Nrfc Protein [Thermus thermophilus HB27]2VPY_B Chain B, Nrfc Protein [Thermus thermophilus HB27]2VPY_F Chain F, Nrfc Protein [Thermus thermophilus HB27]2VPZ_B Chain B, Nrfc Protein [Thermus thermophilus HB27]2VPZ_F Chain F, Nrfc Protein [Ther
MPRYAMAIDLSLCVGCAACAVACKMENEVPPGVFNLWIREREVGEYPNLVVEFRPEQCLHCENPPCVPVCPTGASYQTKDGLVLVDPKKCIACGACIAACPYDARYLHPAGYVSKCTFCAHRLEKGKVPACVETCPTYCRTFGDLEDPESPVAKALKAAERVDVLRPEQGTRPKLFYLNAPSKKGLTRESEVHHG